MLFGQQISMPVISAPIGLAGMSAWRGEIQAALAANRAGIRFCLSTVPVCSLAEIAQAVRPPSWFHPYMIHERALMIAL